MRLRLAAYLAGLAALVAALVLPGGSLESHVLSHSLISVVAAPLLVLAAPLAVALGLLPGARRRRALVLLRRRPLRWLAAPIVAWAAFVAVHWIALVAAAHGVEGLPHLGLHLLLLVTALLFWLPVLGRGPVPRPVRGAAASLYLFLAMPAVDITAVWLFARGDVNAGAIMLASMLPLGVAAVAVSWRWIVREERLARLSEASR